MSDGRPNSWRLRCPQCGVSTAQDDPDSFTCSACSHVPPQRDGAVQFTQLDDRPNLSHFIDNYQKIRTHQGYTGHESAFYQALPDYPNNLPDTWIWAIRKRGYARLLRHLRHHHRTGSKMLDLGSGNGWLSHQLSKQGYDPCAVDLNDDPDDGLRAKHHFPLNWPAILSSFDALPFDDNAVDVAIYNGSFHYSEDQTKTLAEAMRVIRPGGQIIIMDSPIYTDGTSGQTMMADRAAYHKKTFDHEVQIDMTGYLTWADVRSVTQNLGLKLAVIRPWYGFKWALKPYYAKLRGAREPAQFALLVMTVLDDV